ncbi:MAG: 50S ribosomal protein L21e [Candidatus Thermoplasmatota archaeon]
MVKRSKGLRSKSRKKLRKKTRKRGLSSITKSLQKFEKGDPVAIVIDSAVQKGMPHIRFHGHTGKIQKKQGDAYVVSIKDQKQKKNLIIRPEHLRKVQQ